MQENLEILFNTGAKNFLTPVLNKRKLTLALLKWLCYNKKAV